MTEYLHMQNDGTPVCECTYHQVVAFEGDKVNIAGLTRGVTVHVTGRLRTSSYTAADGTERTFTEVVALSLKVLE